MDIRIEAVTKESRTYQGRISWGVLCKGKWINLYVTDKPKPNQTYSVLINENPGKNGKTFYNAELMPSPPVNPKPSIPTQPPLESNPAKENGASGGTPAVQDNPREPEDDRVSSHDWEYAMRLFHAIALELEPDGTIAGEDQTGENAAFTTRVITVDRSAARVALVQTGLVALRDNKIRVEKEPEPEEGMPF